MKPRERLQSTLRHRTPDRIPADFGGGPATLIHPTAYAHLLEHLGLPPEHVIASNHGEGQVVRPSNAVLERFEIDVRGIDLPGPGVAETRGAAGESYIDSWGVTWRKAEPKAPYLAIRGPLQSLDWPTEADASSFPHPDKEDPRWTAGLRERCLAIRKAGDHALVLNLGNVTFALAQRVRGFTEMFEDLLLNPRFSAAFMERITEVVCGIIATALDDVGDLLDCVSIADDMGMQQQPYMRPELYRKMVKPHHLRVVETIRRHTDAVVILHSDGSVVSMIPDFIDIGIEVLNPVQVSAAGMDTAVLKREYGADLTFWGAIDTHRVLPYGSPDDVRDEVRRRIDDLGTDGGFVIASVHNIQAETPPENVVAMFTAPRT